MGHAITRNSLTGEWEVMTRGAAWHNLGQIVTDAQTWQDTMRLAGLDWLISKRQLQFNGQEVPSYALFRDDLIFQDPAKAYIAPTTPTYEPLQNQHAFDFLDILVENDGGAHYEAAGSLNGGAQMFALLNIGLAFDIAGNGDRHESYLLFTDDRTGNRAAKCFMTTVRVVCANTLQMALGREDEGASVRFRHTSNVRVQMEAGIALLGGARRNAETLKAKLQLLSRREMTRESMQAVLDKLFPAGDDPKADNMRRLNKMNDLLSLYEANDTNMFPGIRGTAYNLLNAVTEYTDHYAGIRRSVNKLGMTDNAIRAERAMLGEGSAFKMSAMDELLMATANNPTRTPVMVAAGLSRETGRFETGTKEVGAKEVGRFEDDGIIDAEIVD